MPKFTRGGYLAGTKAVDGTGRVLVRISLLVPSSGHKQVKGNCVKTITLEKTKVSTVYDFLCSRLFPEDPGYDPISLGQ